MTGTTEQLLSALLQSKKPCPDICNNVPPYTTTASNIHSGLVISGYENVQGYNYTVSGGTPCTVQYIDKYGNTNTLNQTGAASTICAKQILSNTCTILTKGSACF